MKSWTILLSTLCLFSCNQQENKFEKYDRPADRYRYPHRTRKRQELDGRTRTNHAGSRGSTRYDQLGGTDTGDRTEMSSSLLLFPGCNPRIPGQPLDERLLYTRLRQRHNYAAQQQARNRPGQTRLHFRPHSGNSNSLLLFGRLERL